MLVTILFITMALGLIVVGHVAGDLMHLILIAATVILVVQLCDQLRHAARTGHLDRTVFR
jgi:hypothetical protein